ncbi:hypothetical protein FRB90_008860 [Tulasnella sp. 427]|nr:hypothetical protein FRB90_008860 [Tulasnella sp. 427]
MATTSTTRVLVPVSEPTALAGETSLKLPAQDLFRNYVYSVHVIPSEIDVERFKSAVSKAVSRYPHTAGRLVREGDDWRINLKNSPVPVRVAKISPPSSELSATYPFPNDFTVQPGELTQPFLNSEDCGKILVPGTASDSLLGFKLTIWENGTAIGISWSHTCGDAFSMWEFCKCLSAYYVNLDAQESELPLAPSLYRHFFRSPFSRQPEDADFTENFLPRMPHLAKDYDLPPLWQKYAGLDAISDQVQLRLSGGSIEKMYKAANEDSSTGEEKVKVTLNDALAAYLIKVLNQCQADPVHTIILILNYRGSNTKPSTITKFNAPSAQGNVIMVMYSDPLPPSSAFSLPALTRFIRTTINFARDHKFLEKWMSWASYLLGKSSNAGPDGRFQYFGPEEGEVSINSYYGSDWNDIHFGFPGKARYFTSWSSLNYFRIFNANPQEDGLAASPSGVSDADICVRIHKDFSKKFISIITQDFPDTLVE